MNIINIVKKGLYGLNISLRHYPYALFFSTLTTILVIILRNIGGSYNSVTINNLQKLAMVLALGFPLFLCIKSIFDKRTDIKILYKIIIRITAIFLLIAYYAFFLKEINMVSISRYTAVNLTLYLLFLIIPYFYKRKNFELFVVNIFSRLATTIIYSLVLFIGLSITLFTLNRLLNIPVTENLYISTWFVVIGIFAPIFLLAGIPKQNENINRNEYPQILKILFLYIVMPLITVYTSILYLYFAKILLNRQWPEGLVAHLVLWYASLSILVLFFISTFKEKNSWVKSFIRWFPKVLVPLLLMMFTAIGIRINIYGVTENRYYVVLLGLWTLGIMSYYIFSRKKNNIILPLSLAILAFFAVFGPWSSYSVSIYSQNKRFEEIIQKYDIIKNNTIIKKKKLSEADQQEIHGILRYFDNSHQFSDLKYLPDNFKDDDVEEYFGFPYQSRKYDYSQLNYFSYNLNKNKQIIDVKNYDYLFHVSNYYNELNSTDSNVRVKLNNLNKVITIKQNDIDIYSQSLLSILTKLHVKNKNIPVKELKQEEFIFIDENKDINVKIIFNSFYGRTEVSNPNNISFQNINFNLLIKLK